MALLATPVERRDVKMDEKLPLVVNVDERSPVEAALNLMRTLAENAALGLAADEQISRYAESALVNEVREQELTLHLRGALERAASKNSESMEALRLAVCMFTIALRDEGTTPEVVLVRLKAAIRYETLLPLWETSSWSGPHLHETVTTWCIKDYFSEKGCAENE